MRRIVLAAVLILVVSACNSGGSDTTTTLAATTTELTPVTTTTTSEPQVTTTASPTTTSSATTTTAATTTTVASSVTTDPYLPAALPRTVIPWDEVGSGWYVALFDASSVEPDSSGVFREGPVVLYLVDSEGNRYEIASWTDFDSFRPWMLADAGGTSAIVVGTGADVDEQQYHFVDLATGDASLIHTAGFPENGYSGGPTVLLTRPTGANVVIYRSDGAEEWLERRSPSGSLLATVFSQPYVDSTSSLRWMYGYDGTSLIVSHHGGIAEVSNTGDQAGELWVPQDHRCDPVRWWDADTFLAACYGRGPGSAPVDEFGNPHTYYGRLWLLETDGTAGVAMTEYPATPPFVVDFGYHDAWPAAGETYVQWSGDCGAAAVHVLQSDGTGVPLAIDIPASIVADGVAMIDVVDGEVALHGWQGCGGDVGVLFATDLSGTFTGELVPVVGDARSVIGVVGLATVYP